MKTHVLYTAIAVGLAALCRPGMAHETEEKLASPGFRPACEGTAAFLKAEDGAVVAVHPTIVRTVEGTSHSAASQQQIVSAVKGKVFTKAVAKTETIDPGELKGGAQFGIFQNDMQTIGEIIKGREGDADYHLVMAFLLPPGNRAVFGIHVYVLTPQGENAFSFLLNSHHKLFVDADMTAEDASDASRAALVKKATRTGLTALLQQIHAAQEHSAD